MCVSLAASPGDDVDDVSRKSNAVFVFDVPAEAAKGHARRILDSSFSLQPQRSVLMLRVCGARGAMTEEMDASAVKEVARILLFSL